MKPAKFLFAALLLAAAIGLSSPPARAQWCTETSITVLPQTVAPGSTTAFSILVWNTGTEATTLTSVEVHFSWEATARVLGGGTIDPASSRTFTVTPSAAPTGSTTASVEVRLAGFRTNPTTDGDVCTETVTITLVNIPGGGFFAGAIAGLILLAIIVVIVVVVIVVVVVVATRKKPQAPPPPPYAPPPGPPPAQPPTPPSP